MEANRDRPASLIRARSRVSESGWNGGLSGHHAEREVRLAWLSQAVEKVVNLRGIDREKGEAGMKMFPIIGALYRTHEPTISPAAVDRELFDDGRNVWRVYLLK